MPVGHVYYPTPVDTLVRTTAATELVSPLVLTHMPKPFMVVTAPFDLLDDVWAEDKSDTDLQNKRDQIDKDYRKIVDNTNDKISKQKGTLGMFAQK